MESFNGLISLGVGGTIAIVILYLWRQERKDTEKRWCDMIKEVNDTRKADVETRKEHTATLARLSTMMEQIGQALMNRRDN